MLKRECIWTAEWTENVIAFVKIVDFDKLQFEKKKILTTRTGLQLSLDLFQSTATIMILVNVHQIKFIKIFFQVWMERGRTNM